ncbi:uncharacterized protein RSE6_05374 [Rhynchosporium secalis]|uniref:Uncharacterized protein n=1 Tax=Rhynchosporium secalis TaxID=38038 RepID=A0A1E1M7N7_RHYSE|nr:uncharacterized protein RSE6_05374 [Rhynchosporium secalis]
MKHEDILLSHVPLFLVHKGWNSRQQRRATAEATPGDRDALIPNTGNNNGNVRTWTLDRQQILAKSGKRGNEKGAAKASNEKRRETSDAARPFQFVNTTRPDRPSDPELRKLVMSHVKTGVKRGPNVSKTPKFKSTTDHSTPITDTIPERGPCHLNIEARISPTLRAPMSGASSARRHSMGTSHSHFQLGRVFNSC